MVRPAAIPTRSSALALAARICVHVGLRWIADRHGGIRRVPGGERLRHAPALAEIRAPLWSSGDDEWILQAGKVQTLRVAARRLHGVEVDAGRVLSFWAQVGRPTARRGFAIGREIREGCIVPTIAGGLCQLSNALHGAAVDAGLVVLERHRHSHVVPGSATAGDRDATVMWNYRDLRIRGPHAFRIEVTLDADTLCVRIRGVVAERRARVLPVATERRTNAPRPALQRSCLSCDETACFRHRPRIGRGRGHRTWLLDGVWPEHDAWLRAELRPGDRALCPIDGERVGRPRYAWSLRGMSEVGTFPALAIRRAIAARRLPAQGGARQRALLDLDDRLAAAMAHRLPPQATRLVVMQDLLPWLWRHGQLGGRRFDVLMTRLPLADLHARLDDVARLHPSSPTAADFRTDDARVEAEAQALHAADRIVTPHAEIAAMFGPRAVLLPWHVPTRVPAPVARIGRPRLLLPASALARKGAYELREALADDREIELCVHGSALEHAAFWHPRSLAPGPVALHEVDAVVLPAHVEHAPRLLLRALAIGVPVIATAACGLPRQDGLSLVPRGDADALREAIARALDRRATTVAVTPSSGSASRR